MSNRSRLTYSTTGNYTSVSSLPGEALFDRKTNRLITEDGQGGWQIQAAKADVDAVVQTIASKADNTAVTSALAAKADTSALTIGLAGKANINDVTTSLSTKANSSDVTTQLLTKPDIAPTSARSLLTHSYYKAMNDTYSNWVGGNHSNVINYANGGGIYFGTTNFDPSLGSPSVSMWMRGTLHHGIFNAWKMASAAVTAGDATQQPFRDRWAAVIEATWSDSTTNYSETNFRYSKQSGSLPLCVTMDDVGIVGLYLRDVAEYYGPTSTNGAKAISYLTSLLINALARFRDPLQTGSDLIDYGITDPVTGTAFKSNRWGVLYPDPSNGSAIAGVAGGYSSSSFEALWGVLAMYLVARGNLSAALTTAFQNYAVNTYNFLQNLKTSAPSDSSRPSQGQMFAAFNLDPNINANNNSSVNGGMAYRGSYDTNQRYHQPVDAYFGKGIRALTAVWDICTIWYGVLCAQLYQATGTASYLTEAQNSGTTMVSTQGCGRMIDGLLHIGNLRDPHSAGVAWPWYMQIMQTTPNFDPSYVVRGALIRTARRIAASSDKGNLGPDWTGAEYSPNEKTWTWGETSAVQGSGGSGQAKATQQMTHGCGLTVVVAAMSVVNVETTIDTQDSKRSVMDQLGSMVSSIRSITDQTASRTSWTVNGRLTIQDATFYDNYEPNGPVRNWYTDGSGNRTFDTYNKNSYTREFWVGGSKVGHFDSGGFTVDKSMGVSNTFYPATSVFSLAFSIGGDGNSNPVISYPGNSRDVMNLSSSNREFWIGNYRVGYWGGGGFGLMSTNALRYNNDSSTALFVSSTDGSYWHTYGNSGAYDNYSPSSQDFRRYCPGGGGYDLSPSGMNLYGAITVGGVCWPDQPNARDLGGSNNKQWKNLFVQNSPSVSSDRRYKTPRADADGGDSLSSAELDAGLEIAKAVKVWMRNSAVATDGEDTARWHFGPYVQDVVSIFAKHGLVSLNADGSLPTDIRYAAFIYSSWDATPAVSAVPSDPGVPPSSDGKDPGRPPSAGKPAIPAREAGNEWHLRNDYIQWIVQAALSRENDRIEARLAILENTSPKGA
jgi:hypothetical protein